MNENHYLTNIPHEILVKHGLCKTLQVRHEVIHFKHILTEVFVQRSVNIQKYLDVLEMSLFDYIEFLTNRLRRVHYFSRQFEQDINQIVNFERKGFFPSIDFYEGLKTCIVLDFDGVVTKNSFNPLFELCLERNPTYICSANPTITED